MAPMTMRAREKFKQKVLTELRESLTDGVSEQRLACEVLSDMPGDSLGFLRSMEMNGLIERCIVGFSGHTVGYRLKAK